MRNKLLLASLIVGVCSIGQSQSSNTKGQEQSSTTQGQEKTTGANQANKARGQNDQGQAATSGADKGVGSITGCLQRGSGSDYTITSADGQKHDIKTSDKSIKLDEHVGHQVTVNTGSGSAGDRASTNTNRTAGQVGDVTSLTMVSTSCP